MNRVLFSEIVAADKGMLRGPFGGDLKKEIFVDRSDTTYKVYEQGVVLQTNQDVGRYHITKEYFNKKMYRFEVLPKDFLVSCSGVNYGAIFQLGEKIERGVINQALLRIRLDNNVIDDAYFYYLFNSLLVNMIVGRKGDSTIPNFPPLSVIKKLEFDLPKLNYQKMVGAILAKIDKKIELNNKINAELEAMAKLIYDYWFVQFDFPDANGKPYKSSGGKMVYNETLKREIPDGWEVVAVQSVVDVRDGTHDSPKPTASELYLVTSKNLKPEGIDFKNANTISREDFDSINKRSRVDSEDVLFSMIGSIGVVYKVDEKKIDFAIKNIALYKLSQKPEYANYIYQSLRSYDMKRYMGNVTLGSIQKFIGLGALRNMPILLKDNLIGKYEEKTASLYEHMSLLKRENQTLSGLRDWLLPMLMNGQVTVKDS